MSEFAGYSQVICNKWIDEAKGLRCVLQEGHDGPCRAEPLPAGDDGELCGQLKALARCEHSDLSVAEDAAARIAALNAEVARQDEALAQIRDLANQLAQIRDLARQLGKVKGDSK